MLFVFDLGVGKGSIIYEKIYLHGLGQTSADWTKTIEKLGDTENSMCPDLTKINREEKVTYRGLYTAFSDECKNFDGKNICKSAFRIIYN